MTDMIIFVNDSTNAGVYIKDKRHRSKLLTKIKNLFNDIQTTDMYFVARVNMEVTETSLKYFASAIPQNEIDWVLTYTGPAAGIEVLPAYLKSVYGESFLSQLCYSKLHDELLEYAKESKKVIKTDAAGDYRKTIDEVIFFNMSSESTIPFFRNLFQLFHDNFDRNSNVNLPLFGILGALLKMVTTKSFVCFPAQTSTSESFTRANKKEQLRFLNNSGLLLSDDTLRKKICQEAKRYPVMDNLIEYAGILPITIQCNATIAKYNNGVYGSAFESMKDDLIFDLDVFAIWIITISNKND